MVAPLIIAAAAPAAASATKDGGIINTLLKVSFIVAILGLLLLGFMWVTGEFSLAAIFDPVVVWYNSSFKKVWMNYTPIGWAITGFSAVLSLFTGKIPTLKKFW